MQKKIQEAMLVSESYLKETLPKSFIFYQPKDIISGDFYWAHKDESNIFFTVSDCTGHGVPGALMSMIGTTPSLNEIIVEMKFQETDKILNEMRNQIIKNLHQEESNNQRDGMDMTLVKLNFKKREIEFSSANNVLVHVSNGNLNSYKGDHQPVGFYSGKNISFTKQKIKVDKNDMIYIFSDGYQDQFGGENKKYMFSRLKKLLIKVSNEDVNQQLNLIESEFNSWKGDNEQIDDVCLMGLRINLKIKNEKIIIIILLVGFFKVNYGQEKEFAQYGISGALSPFGISLSMTYNKTNKNKFCCIYWWLA